MDVRGADDFARLAKALKEGPEDLQREFSKAVSKATAPLKTAARESARQTLPRRGGLADRVARSRFATRRSTGRRAGVRVTVSSPDALGQLDRGVVRHPVFGNRNVWVTQSITPGWWTKPTDQVGPEVQRALLAAMDEVGKKL
jgi:hypothetical protein